MHMLERTQVTPFPEQIMVGQVAIIAAAGYSRDETVENCGDMGALARKVSGVCSWKSRKLFEF